MNILRENIPRDNQVSTSSSTPSTTLSTDNFTTSASSSTNNFTTRSSNTYIYGTGIAAVLTIGECLFFFFFAYNKKVKQAINEQPIKLKRCNMLEDVRVEKILYNK